MKFLKSETGAFGIKEIAAVVAIIVVRGDISDLSYCQVVE